MKKIKKPNCKYCYDKKYFSVAEGGNITMGDFIGDKNYINPLKIMKHPCRMCNKPEKIDEYSGTPKCICTTFSGMESDFVSFMKKHKCKLQKCPHGVVGTEGSSCPKCAVKKCECGGVIETHQGNNGFPDSWYCLECGKDFDRNPFKDQSIESNDSKCQKQPSVNSGEVEKCLLCNYEGASWKDEFRALFERNCRNEISQGCNIQCSRHSGWTEEILEFIEKLLKKDHVQKADSKCSCVIFDSCPYHGADHTADAHKMVENEEDWERQFEDEFPLACGQQALLNGCISEKSKKPVCPKLHA